MAKKPLGNWGTWQQTRNTLVTSLGMNMDALNDSALGSAERTQLGKNIERTLADMQEHALNGLRMLDQEAADANLAALITAQSKEAKREADRIKNATKDVQKLTKLVGKLTELVGLFGGL